MKNKKFTITQEDFLLANRKASRQEEIDAHGRQVIFRSHLQKSQKIYDRKRMKRAAVNEDGSSFSRQNRRLNCILNDIRVVNSRLK